MARSTYFGFNPPFLTPTQVMPLQTDERLIKNDILQLLLTVPGERSFRPDFGTSIKSSMFEPIDTISTDDIRNSIVVAIQKFEPRVLLRQVIVQALPDQNIIQIKLYCSLTTTPNLQFNVDLNLPAGPSVTTVPPIQQA